MSNIPTITPKSKEEADLIRAVQYSDTPLSEVIYAGLKAMGMESLLDGVYQYWIHFDGRSFDANWSVRNQDSFANAERDLKALIAEHTTVNPEKLEFMNVGYDDITIRVMDEGLCRYLLNALQPVLPPATSAWEQYQGSEAWAKAVGYKVLNVDGAGSPEEMFLPAKR